MMQPLAGIKEIEKLRDECLNADVTKIRNEMIDAKSKTDCGFSLPHAFSSSHTTIESTESH